MVSPRWRFGLVSGGSRPQPARAYVVFFSMGLLSEVVTLVVWS